VLMSLVGRPSLTNLRYCKCRHFMASLSSLRTYVRIIASRPYPIGISSNWGWCQLHCRTLHPLPTLPELQ
jgi:hypothetical protein